MNWENWQEDYSGRTRLKDWWKMIKINLGIIKDNISGLKTETGTELDKKADKQVDAGGFAAGKDVEFGYNGNDFTGVAAGQEANSRLGGAALGHKAYAWSGGAVGDGATVGGSGGAVGDGAKAGDGFSGGKKAVAQVTAVQLGEGTNTHYYTAQIFDYELIANDIALETNRSATDGSKYLKDVGKLSNLTTTDKTDIVSAINNLNSTLDKKQNKLTFDFEPTANSTNPVTSGGVKSALDGKADKQTANGGFEAGDNAQVRENCKGAAIGHDTYSYNGGSVGDSSFSMNGGSVGNYAYTENGGAVGENAQTSSGFAGGRNAKAYSDNEGPIDAIQLGTGTNPNEYTMQVYDYQLLVDDATTKSATDGSKYLKDVGKLSSLATSVKDNIVNAVNSLVAAHNDLKLKSVPHKDVSGYPVTFADHLADEEFIKCNVYGSTEGIGNLDSADGKYKIPVTLTGKNVLPYPYKDPSKTGNGISFTVNGDGSVSLTGTATGKATYYFTRSLRLKSGTYTLSETMKNQSSNVSIILDTYAGGKFLNSYSASAKKTTVITLSQDATVSIYAYVSTGVVCENYPVKPQLEIGTTETEYEPYTVNSATAVLDTALGEHEYIDIINKKRYGTDGSATDITVSGSLKTIDSAKNYISCDTATAPSKIELSYWQDINKVLSETTNAILAQGGDV